MRFEEWHVTVDGVDPIRWRKFCVEHDIKPLYIELNNFNTQLMCATAFDPIDLINSGALPGIHIVRVKHEVSTPTYAERQIYWECHVKFNGPFHPRFPCSSRDLYRIDRWYATWRHPEQFDAAAFAALAIKQARDCKFAGYEYECAIQDSNPSLDKGWL